MITTIEYQPDKGEGIEDKVTPLKLKLSDLGCRSVIKMIFFDNLVHGDMHPGKSGLYTVRPSS